MLFHLPLLEEAFEQMELLQHLLNNLPLSDNVDWWHYIWGNNQYSSKEAYLQMAMELKLPKQT